jgi:hypothetical protein
MAKFRQPLPKFGKEQPDSGKLAKIWSPDSPTGQIPACLLESSGGRWHRNPCDRIPKFRLPTNSNVRRWRIPTNVSAGMKSLNLKTDLRLFTIFKTVNRFLKIKEVFTVKMKIIFVDHHFRLYQTPKNT